MPRIEYKYVKFYCACIIFVFHTEAESLFLGEEPVRKVVQG